MFIAIYGVNNIGKSTQSKLLVESLNKAGHKSVHIKFPIYDLEPTGHYINSVLRSTDVQKISEPELQMWFALNRHQFEPQLRQYLQDGYIVVAEDYIGTSLAWGSAKGAALPWLENLNQHLVKEDLAILLNGTRSVDATEANHIHENNQTLITKVTDILKELAVAKGWKIVERQEEQSDTQKLIFDIVKSNLN